MNVNATFVVQIIHIGIAWALIWFMVLKKAFAYSMAKQQERHDMQATIDAYRVQMQGYDAIDKRMWRDVREYMQNNKPLIMTIMPSVAKRMADVAQVDTASSKEIDAIADSLVRAGKVIHDG